MWIIVYILVADSFTMRVEWKNERAFIPLRLEDLVISRQHMSWWELKNGPNSSFHYADVCITRDKLSDNYALGFCFLLLSVTFMRQLQFWWLGPGVWGKRMGHCGIGCNASGSSPAGLKTSSTLSPSLMLWLKTLWLRLQNRPGLLGWFYSSASMFSSGWNAWDSRSGTCISGVMSGEKKTITWKHWLPWQQLE